MRGNTVVLAVLAITGLVLAMGTTETWGKPMLPGVATLAPNNKGNLNESNLNKMAELLKLTSLSKEGIQKITSLDIPEELRSMLQEFSELYFNDENSKVVLQNTFQTEWEKFLAASDNTLRELSVMCRQQKAQHLAEADHSSSFDCSSALQLQKLIDNTRKTGRVEAGATVDSTTVANLLTPMLEPLLDRSDETKRTILYVHGPTVIRTSNPSVVTIEHMTPQMGVGKDLYGIANQMYQVNKAKTGSEDRRKRRNRRNGIDEQNTKRVSSAQMQLLSQTGDAIPPNVYDPLRLDELPVGSKQMTTRKETMRKEATTHIITTNPSASQMTYIP
eukprot:Nk52_evm6s123 gene=Nk52_evmTU6s123